MINRLMSWLLGSRVKKAVATSILAALTAGISWVQSLLSIVIPPEVLENFTTSSYEILQIIVAGIIASYFDKKLQSSTPETPTIIKK